jgi:hypothetical protein
MMQYLRNNKVTYGFVIASICVGLLIIFYTMNARNDNSSSKPKEEYKPVNSSLIKDSYDVVVIGTDPEGISAAVSAARNQLSVLLVDGYDRELLGGLMTLGWLNSLDPNYSPEQPSTSGEHNFLNKGIFQEWYDMIEGTSFDVTTAAKAFHELVQKEKNIDLLMKVRQIEPILIDNKAVTGIKFTDNSGKDISVNSKVLIDATQNADVAYKAGVPFTFAREDIGDKNTNMAVTLVFKLGNVTNEVWDSFGKHPNTGSDSRSAWGFPEMWEYPSTNKEAVRMRGLNIGRQNDNTILINALQIFGIDPLNQADIQRAFDIGKKEIPNVVDYLKQNFKEFKDITLLDTAPELYIRESRHMLGEYRLNILDLLENRDQWDRIAFGSYNVDIQSTSSQDRGQILLKPVQYAIPFRSIVPKNIDGLLVVGRSASFDSLPHGSARVIPVGMATGQAAGVAAKLYYESGLSFREISGNKQEIEKLQEMLNAQGMEIHPFKKIEPLYMKNPNYRGLKVAISMNMVSGGEKNEFNLDEKSNKRRFINNLMRLPKVHPDYFDAESEIFKISSSNPEKEAVTLDGALESVKGILKKKPADISPFIKSDTLHAITDKSNLTNGNVYMIIADIVEGLVGVTYN